MSKKRTPLFLGQDALIRKDGRHCDRPNGVCTEGKRPENTKQDT